jgi:hypothetical protein
MHEALHPYVGCMRLFDRCETTEVSLLPVNNDMGPPT